MQQLKSHVCETGCSTARHSFFFFLTIRKGPEDDCRAEAAITGGGVCPDLHLVLSGPAEVCEHGLVFVALSVMALILTAPLLQEINKYECVRVHGLILK